MIASKTAGAPEMVKTQDSEDTGCLDYWPHTFSIPARLPWWKKGSYIVGHLPSRADDFILTSLEFDVQPAMPTKMLDKVGQRLLKHKRIEPRLLRRLVLGVTVTVSVAGIATYKDRDGTAQPLPTGTHPLPPTRLDGSNTSPSILILPHQKAWLKASCFRRQVCDWKLEAHLEGICCPAGKGEEIQQRLTGLKL